MYPDIQHLLQALFGVEMPAWLSIFKTFGLLVALSFLGAAWTLVKELKRKEEEGLLVPTFSEVEVGKPATANDLLVSAILGFLIGYKAGGMFSNAAAVGPDPMGYLFSVKGNLLIGIAGALIMAYVKYADKKKQQLPEPTMKKIVTYPHQRISEIVMIAAVGGIAGAKIFNAFETWDDFILNPVESLLSSSGLTFYGGLIVATLWLMYYCRKHKIPFKHLCDAAAPGLILAYGLGRLGCHFAGDGDWGIYNSAYITEPTGILRVANPEEYQQMLQAAHVYFINNFGTLADVPHISATAPGWLPDWLFAMNYPHNVNNEGVAIMGCTDNYCAVLPVGVFPTPLYEFAACMLIFLFLWSIRKRLNTAWQMFGVYLIFNGLERFFIEKIRVNYKYNWGFLHPTQAEIISCILILIGIGLLLSRKKKNIAA
jgi:prolipoprotein diacylglyceryltransferase